ncbi:MAG: alpha-hydroxy acid oxidase [Nostocoides sp.]
MDFTFRLRGSTAPLSLADWQRRARRRVPRMVWAYVEGGADEERTLRANRSAFEQWRLVPRILTGTGSADLSTVVAGQQLDMPVLIAPTGLNGAAHWQGDLAAARAARTVGTRLVVSSAASYTLEEVAGEAGNGHWFQLYPWRNRALIGSLVDRARDAGYAVLVVTVDVPVYGNRLRERRVGMSVPPELTPARILDAARHPAWVTGYLRHHRTTLANLEVPGTQGLDSFEIQTDNLGGNIDWDDLAWLRSRWDGPMLVKGVLHPNDAARVVEMGADGVVVSNHGGRQLDAAVASVDALPAIVERIGDRADVLVDGGFRSAADIATALALGARAVLIGRPVVYGLAAGGTNGATEVMRALRADLERTLVLMGASTAGELTADHLYRVGTQTSDRRTHHVAK